MELPEQQECSVPGALGFALRVSKFYGVAFCDFHNTGEGLRISVSRCAGYYGKFIILLCITLSAVSLVLDSRLDKELSLHSQSISDITVNMGSSFLISVVLLVEVYFGAQRIKESITCLARIEKIEEDLNNYGPPKSFVKIKRNLALWSLLGGHAVVVLDATILVFEMLDKDSNIVLASMYIAYYVEAMMLKVLILQISLIFTTVLSAFYHLNNCLKLLQQQVNKELLGSNILTLKTNKQNVFNNIPNKLINNAIDSMAREDTNDQISNTTTSTVRILGTLYHSLCEVVDKMNDNHGVFFVSLMLYFLLHLVIAPYLLLSRISEEGTEFYRALIQFLWVAYHISDMALIVEPCHRTHEQINKTKQIISQLLRSTPPEHFNFVFELEVFYKLLVANDAVYTPMNMFTLDRTVVTAIFGSIVTYLVVIVQGV